MRLIKNCHINFKISNFYLQIDKQITKYTLGPNENFRKHYWNYQWLTWISPTCRETFSLTLKSYRFRIPKPVWTVTTTGSHQYGAYLEFRHHTSNHNFMITFYIIPWNWHVTNIQRGWTVELMLMDWVCEYNTWWTELGQEVPSQWKLLPFHRLPHIKKELYIWSGVGGRRERTVRGKAKHGEQITSHVIT